MFYDILDEKRKKVFKSAISVIGVMVLLMTFFFGNFVLAGDIKDTKKSISKTEKELKVEQEKLAKKEGELIAVKGQVYITQKTINSTQSEIESTKEIIDRKEKEIERINSNIKYKKSLLEKMVQTVYLQSQQPIIYLFIEKDNFTETVANVDSFLRMKGQILDTIKEIKNDKEKVTKEKEELEGVKEKKSKLLVAKEMQKNALLSNKNYLEVKVAKKRRSVAEIKAKLAKLKSALSSFLGKSFDAKDIVEAVKFASKKTGVRKEFLMAMLDKETDLGRFTGGCTYKNTKVKNADKVEFKKICKELDYNYKKKKISCAASWGGYGGAMGVAQFMPTTWIGYKNAIAGYTGHNPPDPWNLTDGVVGMAEKLRRAGAASKKREHYAAKVYYCGSSRSSYWKTKCEAYADTVKNWADGGYDEFFK